MTAITPTETAPRRLGGRTMNVVRLQLLNTHSFVLVPLIVLAGAALVSILIFAMIPGDDVKVAGAANAPMWYFVALGVQAMTLAFPFSQAMSITRREFYVGSLIMGVIGAVGMATLFIILAGIETLTNGYGVNGRVAKLDYLFEPGWASAWLSYFAFTLFLFVVGFLMATIWKRFGTLAVVSVGVVTGLVVLVAIFIITKASAWMSVIGWFVDITALGVTLIGLGVTAVLTVVSYALLRRTTA